MLNLSEFPNLSKTTSEFHCGFQLQCFAIFPLMVHYPCLSCQVEKAKQDDALSDLSNLLGELKDMAADMGTEIERFVTLTSYWFAMKYAMFLSSPSC